jgi:ABC-type sugar transport system substrate-binding protein
MKKLTAIILALTVCLSMAACGDKSPGDSETSSGGGVSPSETQTPPDSGASPDAETPPPTEPADTPDGPPAAGCLIGYITDDVDHQARDTYDIVYMYSAPSNLTRYMMECMQNLSERLNVNVTEMTANGDADLFVNNIETVALTEPDGFVMDMVYEYQARIMEILENVGIPYISLFNSVLDGDDRELVPVVMMNHLLNGQKQVEFMAENYKTFWGGDVDPGEIALLVLTFSLNLDLQTRGVGAETKFNELFPGNAVFVNDASTGSMNAQTAFDLSNGTIAANPNIKYWFVANVVEDMAIGVARAAESLNKTDSILITGSGSSVLPGEWDAGYEGCWVANFAVSNYQYAVPALCGLIAIIDGRATSETLWPEYKRAGDVSAQFVVGESMITHDNYKQFFSDIEKSFGIGV